MMQAQQGVTTLDNVVHDYVARKKLELLDKTVRNLGGTIQFGNNTKFNNLTRAIDFVKSDFQRMLLDNTIAFTPYIHPRNRLAMLNGLGNIKLYLLKITNCRLLHPNYNLIA